MAKSKNTKSKAAPKKGSKAKAGSKSGSKSKASKKRVALNERVAFVYGGSLMKSSNVFVFAVDSKDVAGYVKENLVTYYGEKVNGRYVNCENAAETLERVLELAKEKGYFAEADCNILKVTVNNASALLKEASGTNAAHSLKLNDDDSKKATKKGAKKATKAKKEESEDEESDASEDEEDDVEDEEDVSEDEDEDASDADERHKSESEEEEEPVKPARKRVAKKGNSKAKKSGSKGKQGGKSKNVKNRK